MSFRRGSYLAVWGVACLGLALLLGHGMALAQQAADQAQARDSIARIRVSLIPRQITVLASQMAGRMELLTKRDGETFKKGELLAALDCSLPKASQEKARATLDKKTRVADITANLYKLNSRSALEAAVAQAEAAEAAAELRRQEAEVRRCTIRAPFSGKVSEVRAREKQYLAEGQPILEILDDSRLEIEFIAPSRWISWLVPGRPFKVLILETGKTYAAKVNRLGGKVDPVSQSIKIYGALDKRAPELLAGMSGLADLAPPR